MNIDKKYIIEEYKNHIIRYKLDNDKLGMRGMSNLYSKNCYMVVTRGIVSSCTILFKTGYNHRNMIHGKRKAIKECKEFIDKLEL